MITLIAAIGQRREIGYMNKLLWQIPADLKHFAAYTKGKKVLMGYDTYRSIGQPLKHRDNYVLTRKNRDIPGVTVVNDIPSIIPKDKNEELVIIGGESLYWQTIDIADKLVITHVEAEFKADRHFPVIVPSKWHEMSALASCNDQYNYFFVEYQRRID